MSDTDNRQVGEWHRRPGDMSLLWICECTDGEHRLEDVIAKAYEPEGVDRILNREQTIANQAERLRAYETGSTLALGLGAALRRQKNYEHTRTHTGPVDCTRCYAEVEVTRLLTEIAELRPTVREDALCKAIHPEYGRCTYDGGHKNWKGEAGYHSNERGQLWTDTESGGQDDR